MVAEWDVKDDTEKFPDELIQKNSTSTGFSNINLVINVDILLQSKNYTFILKVGYQGSLFKALFKVKRLTSSLPTPGFCSIRYYKLH